MTPRLTHIVLVPLALGLAQVAGADDHDATSAAESRLLAIGASLPGELQTTYDRDVFRLDLVGRAEIQVRTSGQTDTTGELLGDAGHRLASDDNSGPANNFSIEAELDPGIYYVAVGGATGATGTYSINARIGGARDHGDTVESSTLLKVYTKEELAEVTPSVLLSTAGRIYPSPDDTDVFRIDVDRDDTALILRTSPSSYVTYGVLRNVRGNQMVADEDGNGAFHIETTVDEGIYYVTVTSIEVGAYRILAQGDAESVVDKQP